jgi:hypothetical protein
MSQDIMTTAEATEAAALPRAHEVHCGEGEKPPAKTVPETLAQEAAQKSPARWAYERMILYIQNFEKQLDAEHEVAMGFVGGQAGVMRIEGMGYFDPDLVTFYGMDEYGVRTQLVQHVSQLNVMLRALPIRAGQQEPTRIGFRLAADLEDAETKG